MMRMYKDLIDKRPSKLATRKTKRRTYDKQFKATVIKMIANLRECGLNWYEVESKIRLKYPGLGDFTTFRVTYKNMYDKGLINIHSSEKALETIAEAKANVLVNRKINNAMKQSLHRMSTDEAKWQILCEKLDSYKPKQFKLKPVKIKSSEKDVIYIVGDIHRRSSIDNHLFIDIFSIIKEDIKGHQYKNVDLWFTGDIIDGEIHQEQQRTNQEVIDNSIETGDILVDCINQLPNIRNIKFVYGNHEEVRLWGEKDTDNNVGKYIAHSLKRGLNPNINVEFPVVKINPITKEKEYINELWFKYKDKDILLLHGHQQFAKTKARLIEHCDNTYHKQPHCIVLGHFHTSKTNQFNKNRWLITAPAVKDWVSKWDLNQGYCGLGQFVKLKLNWDAPQITTMNIKEKE